MTGETLTGRDAAEAIGLAISLGNADARFDRRKISAALRSRAGRLRVRAGLVLAASFPRAVSTRARETRPVGRRRSTRVANASASPGRPAEPPRPEIGS